MASVPIFLACGELMSDMNEPWVQQISIKKGLGTVNAPEA
jgi:hypothetical protein